MHMPTHADRANPDGRPHNMAFRDFASIVYLNDDYEGGELHLVEQNYTIKPKPGMLVAFPSDHKFLHAALPTTSGIRYVIVSWAGIVGSPRVMPEVMKKSKPT